MTFNYSICYPNKENIEYRNSSITGKEVLEIATNYPWEEQLQLLYSLKDEHIHYSPSLDFKCLDNEKSFCLTANPDKNNELEFSLWYNRPKKVKAFLGLFGEKEKMIVDDIWSIDFKTALQYLEHFINGNYDAIEALYRKK